MSKTEYSPGLAGVVAGETSIACVDQGKLLYRGYTIQELAEKATFEEVAHLMFYGNLPDKDQLLALSNNLEQYASLAGPVVQALRGIPKDAPMMDVLRSMVSYAGHFDPVEGDEPQHNRQRAVWMTSQIASIIAARYRLINGSDPVEPPCGMSHAARLLYMMHGEKPDALSERLLDLTLVLYAEHEFNASTFTVRVICSTESDLVSAVVGGIGALKGPLHGGANEAAMEMILRFNDAGEAAAWVQDALEKKEKVMGFGHRVYKNGDHRAHILEREMRKLAQQKGEERLVEIYDAIKEPIVNDKGIFPNVDYPCGLTYYLLGLPLEMYTPLFVAARITGWSAHYLEQQGNNKLYRPLSVYTGAKDQEVPPIEQR
ncbi:MAG: bifunctional 2-methylcitrate synthase/citrate synthase [Candidatus Hydrogenedentes bacterium]|nr:bifunctional 2-methylcitrate synthase/citrate synthase [Candidatus Hydrogenedentota bacterium]